MDGLVEARDRIVKLLREDARYERLARKHEGYEARLVELRGKRFATHEEQLEESTLKKLKLSVKDEMERIVREYGE